MSNNITWRTVAQSISNDSEIMESLVESAQAPEKVSRNPVAVYLRMVSDVGDAGFNILPEPNSNQEKKTDGLGFHIGDNKRSEMDANPQRYWDKYFYKANTGETVQGSVYVDMVKDTAIGKSYANISEILKAWNGKEAKPETLQQVVTIDGVAHECSMIDGKQRGDMAAMLDQRINNMANALRRIVGIWRQKKDIEERLSEHVQVTFVYNKRDTPESGLANVKKPILLLELNSNKASDAYGQRTGFAETFAPTVFNALDVDKAVGATTGNKYQILKDSRKERAATKAGAGASTKEKDKTAIEGRVSSSNMLTIMSNIRVFVEDEDSERHLYNRMAAMKKDDREELIASMLQCRDFFGKFDTPDNRKIMKAYSETKTERAKDEAENKIAADIAEQQPTQHQRNAATQHEKNAKPVASQPVIPEATLQHSATALQQPKSGRQPASGGRQRAKVN